jgi:hypothetical protein
MKTDRYSKKRYPIRAEVKIMGEWHPFNCDIKRRHVITTDIGENMATGSKTLVTQSSIDFKAGYKIAVGDKQYTVESSDANIDKTHKGVRRGAARYETRIEVR